MSDARPSAADLTRLAEKYRKLGDLRRARARGEPVPPRGVFKALADEFPGCLNELDTLPLEIIDGRAEALARAAEGGEVADWMGWIARYHALYRAALRIKARCVRRTGPPARDAIDDARAADLARDAADHAGVAVDAGFVRAVANPPDGRITAVILAAIAEGSSASEAEIKRAIFPGSRRA